MIKYALYVVHVEGQDDDVDASFRVTRDHARRTLISALASWHHVLHHRVQYGKLEGLVILSTPIR